MKKNIKVLAGVMLAAALVMTGCGQAAEAEEAAVSESAVTAAKETDPVQETESGAETETTSGQVATASEMTTVEIVVEDWMVPVYGTDVADGVYEITVDSSSSMFKIVSCELTVSEGEMTAVMTMGGTGYTKVYMGTGAEAVEADEEAYIPYVENADGAHTFTVPVEALDMGIDCTAFSKSKEKWYDRTLVFRADSLPDGALLNRAILTAEDLGLEDGNYTAEVTLEGGSGKAYVESPASIRVENGEAFVTLVWSSSKYDYMIVGEEKYLPINTEGNAVFEVPLEGFDARLQVLADTVAMSTPHEIEYTLYFDSTTITKEP